MSSDLISGMELLSESFVDEAREEKERDTKNASESFRP